MAVIHFAPLQGYTDSVYREAHTRVFGGVDTYYTPFVRIEKGGFRNKDLKDIACDRNRQVHVVPQLIASRRVSVDRAFIPREWVPGSGY